VRIDLRLTSQAEWIKVFDPRDGTVFVPIAPPPPVGEQVRIDLVVGDQGPNVTLRGQVVATRTVDPPIGAVIALGPTEREKVNYVNGFVRGGLLNLREKRRLPIRLDVTYGGTTGPCVTFSKDLNEEGIFVLTEQPLPETSQVHLILTVPNHEPLSLTGVVSHTVVPEDEDVPGMGIVFRLDETQRAQLKKVVDELEEALKDGGLPSKAIE
jgi:Tfp pilus assembly protein PilZ